MRNFKPEFLTQEYLQHMLHYDPLTGVWTWMNPLPRSKMRRGDLAGRVTQQGRRQIRIASGFYYSARLAFLYMTGEWPAEQVDHKNRVKDDDRWENLRSATQSQNSFNRAWAEESGIWRGIRTCGNQYAVEIGNEYLGLYKTFEEATAVRDQALKDKAGQFALIVSRKDTA